MRITISAGGRVITGCAVAGISNLRSFGMFPLASSIFGIGISFSTIETSAFVADIVKKEWIGESMEAVSSLMDIDQTRGPGVTGLIITSPGIQQGS
jgi:hypothetical protein